MVDYFEVEISMRIIIYKISSKLFQKTRNKHCFFCEKLGFVALLAAT